MKVQNVKTTEYGMQSIRNAETPDDIEDRSLMFKKTITSLSQEQHVTRLTDLASQIDTQGEKLSKRADIKEFEKYRQLIREFLDEVVSGSYSFSKENSFGSRGRHRVFATVKTVNQKLEAMAKEVLSGEADNISLLHQIDDIRGLILDVML